MKRSTLALLTAPLWGALFVVFLPFAGFGVLLWVCAERASECLKALLHRWRSNA